MSILAYQQLAHIGTDLLDPFDRDLVQPASIDLRLGTTFRVFKHHQLSEIDLGDVPPADEITEEVEVPIWKSVCGACDGARMISVDRYPGAFPDQNGEVVCPVCKGHGSTIDDEARLVIHPGEMILGSTLETITVPPDLVMVLEGKSSLARLGLLPHVAAGYFDPGWRGVGTLELVNLSRVPIILRPGLKICQSRWTRMDAVPSLLYGNERLGSHYQGDDRVAGSRYEG